MQIFLIVVAQGRELPFSKPPFGFKIFALFQIFISEELEVVTPKQSTSEDSLRLGRKRGEDPPRITFAISKTLSPAPSVSIK